MKPSLLFILIWYALSMSAYAGNARQEVTAISGVVSPGQQSEDAYFKVVEVNTRYGLVQYHLHSDEIKVDGKFVGQSGGYDVLDNLGLFQLNGEDIILFQAGNTANVGVPDELFFLILKPNSTPQIIGTPLNPQINEVKKVWREGNVVYVDFVVGDYDKFGAPLKFEKDEVVITKATPVLYLKGGPRLSDEDCKQLYDVASDDCSKTLKEYERACSTAKAGQVETSRFAMMLINRLSELPGFNKNKFNRSCFAWCTGKDISYEEFKGPVCNIK